MALFTIGDLHLSLGANKPMDVFKGWENYTQRLSENWLLNVKENDIVVLAGDTSWAMALNQCVEDFAFLHSLPGQKIILKGNHDYWWTTMRKMETFLTNNGFTSIKFLHNNNFIVNETALCGTRSWLFDVGQPHDEKVMQREKGRLIASLNSVNESIVKEKIVFLHYPPVCTTAVAQEIVDVLHEYGVKRCYYGHLHGASISRARQGMIDGIEYRLISADAIKFNPYRIMP